MRDMEEWGQRKQHVAAYLNMSRQTLDDALNARTINARSTWMKITELRFLSDATHTLVHIAADFDNYAITGDIGLWWQALREALRDGAYILPPLEDDFACERQLLLPFDEEVDPVSYGVILDDDL